MKKLILLLIFIALTACSENELPIHDENLKVCLSELYDLSEDDDLYAISIVPMKKLRESGGSGGMADMINVNNEEFLECYKLILNLKCHEEEATESVSLENLPDYNINISMLSNEKKRTLRIDIGKAYITLERDDSLIIKHTITSDEYQVLITVLDSFD